MGYYKKEEATREAINEDGWLHTGDIGEFEEGEYLKITDRKKEIFKTSGGKYIAPQVMENKFKESLFIEQLIVIGEFKKHPAALIQPSFEFLQEWCKRKNIKYNNTTEIITNERVIDRIGKEINAYNESFAQYKKIKKFKLIGTPWSIDGGELTPTLKLRRKNILEKYKSLVEDIYGDESMS